MKEDRVTEYAARVAAGDMGNRVGHLHVLACKRHMDDLARQGTDGFPYVWSPDRSQDIIDYAETLTIAEGTEPRPVRLLPCQAFDIGCRFGWVKASDGKRRFRRSYKSVSRQNGKSFENGILGTYIAGFSGYRYGEAFTVATKQHQARIVWNEMAKFISADHDLKYDKFGNPDGLFEVKEYASTIEAVRTHCTIEALSRERGLEDGHRPIFASVDELHQHKDGGVWSAIWNGTRSLPETLVSCITTRGAEVHSFCKEMDEYAIGVLRGDLGDAEDFFVDIYALDDGDDPWDDRNWEKSNPYLMTRPELVGQFRADAAMARDMGGFRQRDFLTKALNLWVQDSDVLFIPPDVLDSCKDERSIEDFSGASCTVGLDLSHGGDLTSLSLEIPDGDGGVFVHSHSFMPRGRLEEHLRTDVAPYDTWAADGLLTVTGGPNDFKNDYNFIVGYLRDLAKTYDLTYTAIGYDPHNADGFLAALDSLGATLIEVTQSARSLNDATADIQLMAKSGRLHLNRRSELLVSAILWARMTRNSFGEVKIDKSRRTQRIDPADAMVCAHFAAMKAGDAPVDLGGQMDDYLQMMGW